tara:strand:+ start:63 stop:434 length:372 start_codon:yes stop_codon:yes gene_type:complete
MGVYKGRGPLYTFQRQSFIYFEIMCNIEVRHMTKTTYQTNKTGFIVFDGRIMSIHNFYIEMMGSQMEGPNSLYCHTLGWANLHSFGTKHGSLDDGEVWNIINSTGARFVLYPSVEPTKYNGGL